MFVVVVDYECRQQQVEIDKHETATKAQKENA